MKSKGPPFKAKGLRENPYAIIACDAIASPGEWQEVEVPGSLASAPNQAHYAAASLVFSISQSGGVLYIRYDGPSAVMEERRKNDT